MSEPTIPQNAWPDADTTLSADERVLAQRLALLQAHAPSAAFQQRMTAAALQQRLLVESTAHRRRRGPGQAAHPTSAPTRWPVAFSLALVLSILVLTIFETGYAAAASVPGEPLYRLKRGVESLQLAASQPATRAALQQSFLMERLHELDRLVARQASEAQLQLAVTAYQGALVQVTVTRSSTPETAANMEPLLRQQLAMLAAIQARAPLRALSAIGGAALATQSALDQLARPTPADTGTGGHAPVVTPLPATVTRSRPPTSGSRSPVPTIAMPTIHASAIAPHPIDPTEQPTTPAVPHRPNVTPAQVNHPVPATPPRPHPSTAPAAPTTPSGAPSWPSIPTQAAPVPSRPHPPTGATDEPVEPTTPPDATPQPPISTPAVPAPSAEPGAPGQKPPSPPRPKPPPRHPPPHP